MESEFRCGRPKRRIHETHQQASSNSLPHLVGSPRAFTFPSPWRLFRKACRCKWWLGSVVGLISSVRSSGPLALGLVLRSGSWGLARRLVWGRPLALRDYPPSKFTSPKPTSPRSSAASGSPADRGRGRRGRIRRQRTMYSMINRMIRTRK